MRLELKQPRSGSKKYYSNQSMMTGCVIDAKNPTRRLLMCAGMNDVITKPIQRGALIERIRHYFKI